MVKHSAGTTLGRQGLRAVLELPPTRSRQLGEQARVEATEPRTVASRPESQWETQILIAAPDWKQQPRGLFTQVSHRVGTLVRPLSRRWSGSMCYFLISCTIYARLRVEVLPAARRPTVCHHTTSSPGSPEWLDASIQHRGPFRAAYYPRYLCCVAGERRMQTPEHESRARPGGHAHPSIPMCVPRAWQTYLPTQIKQCSQTESGASARSSQLALETQFFCTVPRAMEDKPTWVVNTPKNVMTE